MLLSESSKMVYNQIVENKTVGENEIFLLKLLRTTSLSENSHPLKSVKITILARNISCKRSNFSCDLAGLVAQGFIIIKKGTVLLTQKGFQLL